MRLGLEGNTFFFGERLYIKATFALINGPWSYGGKSWIFISFNGPESLPRACFPTFRQIQSMVSDKPNPTVNVTLRKLREIDRDPQS